MEQGTNGGSLWLWCCLAQPGALAACGRYSSAATPRQRRRLGRTWPQPTLPSQEHLTAPSVHTGEGTWAVSWATFLLSCPLPSQPPDPHSLERKRGQQVQSALTDTRPAVLLCPPAVTPHREQPVCSGPDPGPPHPREQSCRAGVPELSGPLHAGEGKHRSLYESSDAKA